MVYGASDVATADAIVSAMTWHLDFLLNQNRDFPWKAVLAYHFEVHRHRHAAGRGFQPAAWYGQIANGPFLTNLNQPRPAGETTAGRFDKGDFGSQARQARQDVRQIVGAL